MHLALLDKLVVASTATELLPCEAGCFTRHSEYTEIPLTDILSCAAAATGVKGQYLAPFQLRSSLKSRARLVAGTATAIVTDRLTHYGKEAA